MCSGIDILKKYVCQSCYNVYCDIGVKLLSVKLIYVWFLDVAEPERNTKKTLINWDNGEIYRCDAGFVIYELCRYCYLIKRSRKSVRPITVKPSSSLVSVIGLLITKIF